MDSKKPVTTKVTVTRTYDNGDTITQTYEGYTLQVCQQKGVIKKRDEQNNCIVIAPNGHYRLQIRAYKGCKDWNSFETDSISYSSMRDDEECLCQKPKNE